MGHVQDRWYRKDGTPTARCGQGRRYRVRYSVDGREAPNESSHRKGEATRRLTALEADLLRGQWVDPSDTTTVASYARTTASTRPHSERTAARVESLIRNHLEGTALGGRRLAAVRPSEAQGWVTDRAQHLAPSTLRLLVGLVRQVYAAAVADRLVASSPFARVTLPSAEQERVVPLTVEQVQRLAAVMAPRYQALVLTQAGLGLRLGEALGLRVDDVDFLRRTVRIEHQAAQKSRRLVPPKTPTSRRVLPLPKVAADALAEHLRVFPASAPVGCHCPAKVTCSRSASGLLFHTSTDRPYASEHYGTRVFGAGIERAKLPAGTTPHDLRHHYASVLLAAGESVVAVAERLGHTDATLVLQVYGHLMADREDHTRRAVDTAHHAVFEAPRESATAQGRPR
ncbi:MAG: tyrosine-type recombinase/integrase [Pseudonocardiaceae bacterium]|nr:tyrosine-type recombinase/integrase [Pseudonocardiaceae bacterium]